jgi:pyruvate,orthophosphate dikinase
MLREVAEFDEITQSAPITVTAHGGRAKCLQRLVRLGLPVPQTVAISFDTVHRIAGGHRLDMEALLSVFGDAPLVSVRPSSEDPDWGGPGAILNIGMNDDRHAELAKAQGQEAADRLYRRFVQTFAIHVARLDPDMFDGQ